MRPWSFISKAVLHAIACVECRSVFTLLIKMRGVLAIASVMNVLLWVSWGVCGDSSVHLGAGLQETSGLHVKMYNECQIISNMVTSLPIHRWCMKSNLQSQVSLKLRKQLCWQFCSCAPNWRPRAPWLLARGVSDLNLSTLVVSSTRAFCHAESACP